VPHFIATALWTAYAKYAKYYGFVTFLLSCPVISCPNIEPPSLRRKAATDKLVEKIVKHDSWRIQPDILNPPLLQLTYSKPLSAQVVNSHLVCDPTIWQPRFDLPWQQSSTEPFSHGTGTLWCLQKEMATYRHWSVSLWWDPDDVPHCGILSS